MTKKDFKLIAEIISSLDLSENLKHHVALEFASWLPKTNPKFNRSKFMEACMVHEYKAALKKPLKAS